MPGKTHAYLLFMGIHGLNSQGSRPTSRNWQYPSTLSTGGKPMWVLEGYAGSQCRCQDEVWFSPPQVTLGNPMTSWDSCKNFWSIDWPLFWDRMCCEVPGDVDVQLLSSELCVDWLLDRAMDCVNSLCTALRNRTIGASVFLNQDQGGDV